MSLVPYYEHGGVTIYCGDCREVIPALNLQFDACVTDPPYGLASKEKRSPRRKYGVEPNKRGFMGHEWDGSVPGVETWEAVLDCLKPGAHLMAFGGTRTFHRLACAIEDARFEIRDTLMWLYGSGFPKSLDISKAVGSDTWDGYGTALKPAWEPIILGMRPCDGTFAENALEHGVAGLNIDGSRIELRGIEEHKHPSKRKPQTGVYGGGWADDKNAKDLVRYDSAGRWPANVLLDEDSAQLFPDAPGQLADASTNPDSRRHQNCYGTLKRGSQEASANRRYAESGATNFAALPGARRLDSGSAARFFYTAKADSAERGTGNIHPTVKPLDLMRYLCRLLCPPSGGLFLDPFSGSGTTLLACKALNIRAVGIELSEQYAEIAAKRLSQDVFEFGGPGPETDSDSADKTTPEANA